MDQKNASLVQFLKTNYSTYSSFKALEEKVRCKTRCNLYIKMDFQKEHEFKNEEKKNEDNTDVKTFSSMAFVHLQLQHSSCTTHLTIYILYII